MLTTGAIPSEQVKEAGVDSAIEPRGGGPDVILGLEQRQVEALHVALAARVAAPRSLQARTTSLLMLHQGRVHRLDFIFFLYL